MPQMHDQRMLLDELAYDAYKAGILTLKQVEVWFGLRKPEDRNQTPERSG